MKTLLGLVIAALALFTSSLAAVAPEITTLIEGYNVLAKLPCLGCPFLIQDTSTGENRPWEQRQDDNALLLNFSLEYDSSALTLNGHRIHPIFANLPQVHAVQTVLDISDSDLQTAIAAGQLEASHETSPGGGFFGLSYTSNIQHIKDSAALVFIFDVIEIYSDLTPAPLKHGLEHPDQKVVEIILLQKPIFSAQEPPAMEVIKVSLVPRPSHTTSSRFSAKQTMHFLDWDGYGRKGTPSHMISYAGSAMLDFIQSSVWGLFSLIFGVLVLFILVCAICTFGCDWGQDDYEKAQSGKAKNGKRRRPGDVEGGMPRLLSAEELGLAGRGKVVGLGKSD